MCELSDVVATNGDDVTVAAIDIDERDSSRAALFGDSGSKSSIFDMFCFLIRLIKDGTNATQQINNTSSSASSVNSLASRSVY